MSIFTLFSNKNKMFNQRINEKPTLARAEVSKHKQGPNPLYHPFCVPHKVRMVFIF